MTTERVIITGVIAWFSFMAGMYAVPNIKDYEEKPYCTRVIAHRKCLIAVPYSEGDGDAN